MATLTRGAVVLTPLLVLPMEETRATRSVLHEIIGDPIPDVTARTPGARAATMETLWPTRAAALAAQAALAVTGGPWVVDGHGEAAMSVRVVGDIAVARATEGAPEHIVRAGVVVLS